MLDLGRSKEIFARNLSFLMRLRGISGVQLAKGVNKSASVVSRWLAGEHGPDLATLGEVAEFLEVPERALFVEPGDGKDEIVKIITEFVRFQSQTEPKKNN
jgi:transcriptional regulator with XRE-family HTH domain